MNLYVSLNIRCKSIKFVVALYLYLCDRISFLLNCGSFCVKNARYIQEQRNSLRQFFLFLAEPHYCDQHSISGRRILILRGRQLRTKTTKRKAWASDSFVSHPSCSSWKI